MPPLFLNASRMEYYIPVGYENCLITEQGNLYLFNCSIIEKLRTTQNRINVIGLTWNPNYDKISLKM